MTLLETRALEHTRDRAPCCLGQDRKEEHGLSASVGHFRKIHVKAMKICRGSLTSQTGLVLSLKVVSWKGRLVCMGESLPMMEGA